MIKSTSIANSILTVFVLYRRRTW